MYIILTSHQNEQNDLGTCICTYIKTEKQNVQFEEQKKLGNNRMEFFNDKLIIIKMGLLQNRGPENFTL